MSDPERAPGLSRRGLLALGGGAGIALGAGGVAVGSRLADSGSGSGSSAPPVGSSSVGSSSAESSQEYPFFAETQAGITTPVQDRLHFASYDVRDDISREDLIELLQDWTYAASRMTLGLDVSVDGAFGGGPYLPPDDTGEATGLGSSGLTLTFGFGRSLFVGDGGRDRFGLKSSLPESFTELPTMMNDFMEPERSGGDICVQACANDPQVAVHAIRNLTRIGFGRTRLRWSQLGFGRSSSTSTTQDTPRNLFGQKDGTNNLKAEEPDELARHVWIDDPSSWAHGGTYLVVRRISMLIEIWDGVQLTEQERVLGREKAEGAPLSGGAEFTAPDFSKADDDGNPLIDVRSHVARSHPDNNDGIRMLRRGFNFVDGNDELGRLDAGLLFLAFVNSPERFAVVHRNLARDDMFIEYLKTTGSALFLVPPGIEAGQYVGQQLFEA